MSKPNADQTGSNVVPLGAAISNLCSIVTFASASGIPVEEVTEWVANGTRSAPLVRAGLPCALHRLGYHAAARPPSPARPHPGSTLPG